MKLWEKGQKLNKEIENFVTGNDFLLDHALVKYDCLASIAHAKMLRKINIITGKELSKLVKGLKEIIKLSAAGKFKINLEDEDCHTAIENYLTKKYGTTGEKIHTGRSRNDQVLTALMLYEKAELAEIKKLLLGLKTSIKIVVNKYGKTVIPGYTHMQKAMPTTIKDWLGSFISAVEDDLEMLGSVSKLIDKSPLGSAAGFGVPVLKIDKKMTAKLMGFSKVMDNPVYCQHSRGKYTALMISLLSQIMLDLNKLATDLLLFSMKEFGYIEVPGEFCTGSSIMPQKKNPDALEIIRANYHVLVGEEFKVKGIVSSIMSGYNKDLQLTKEPLFKAIDITKSCLKVMALLVKNIKINAEKCKQAMTPELYATEKAYELVKKGKPFREAYKKIAKEY
jgi:argininosuccinate lyase